MDHDDALIGAHPRREPLALLGGVGAVLLSACASGSKTTSAAQATSTVAPATGATSALAAAATATGSSFAPSCVGEA